MAFFGAGSRSPDVNALSSGRRNMLISRRFQVTRVYPNSGSQHTPDRRQRAGKRWRGQTHGPNMIMAPSQRSAYLGKQNFTSKGFVFVGEGAGAMTSTLGLIQFSRRIEFRTDIGNHRSRHIAASAKHIYTEACTLTHRYARWMRKPSC